MKSQRILGILWLALCSYIGFPLLWQLSHTFGLSNFRPTPDFYLAIFSCLLYLAGAVASLFLFRGAQWARGFIRVVSILTVIAMIAQVIAFRSLSLWGGIIGLFALVSLVFLFLPRHEPVA